MSVSDKMSAFSGVQKIDSHNCTDLLRVTERGVTWLECQECGAQWDTMLITFPKAGPVNLELCHDTVNNILMSVFDDSIYGGYTYAVRMHSASYAAVQVLMAGGKFKTIRCNKRTANAILSTVAERCKYTELVAVYPERYKV
jgi:hypothetical protein